jgi:hypothetical protein
MKVPPLTDRHNRATTPVCHRGRALSILSDRRLRSAMDEFVGFPEDERAPSNSADLRT